MNKNILASMILFFLCVNTKAQVTNTSYQTKTNEKILQFSIIVPIDKNEAWNLFTKDEILVKWIAPVAHIDLKNGGSILTNYDKTKSISDSSSIKLGIISYLENELLVLKVNLNKTFSQKTRDEDKNLQEIIQFVQIEPGKTKIISSMVGWGQGKDWDVAYNFFVKGNDWTSKQILNLFK